MIRSHIACMVLLAGLAALPAAAADYSWRGPVPSAIQVAPPVVGPGPTPFYVVDHGPQLSGPGIMITDVALKNTGVWRAYPFIGTFDDLTPVVVTMDYYGVSPATFDPAARMVMPRKRYVIRSPMVRRKPAKARRAR